MGKNCIDRTGQRFNSWTVVKKIGSVHCYGRWEPLWECRCACGNVRQVPSHRVGPGMSDCCGCSKGPVFKARYDREGMRFVATHEVEWMEGCGPLSGAGHGSGEPDGFKRCGRCGRVLPLSAFTHNRNRPGGYGYECKECRKRYNDSVRLHKADMKKASLFRRFSFPGSGRPLPCPERFAHEHADDWMFGDTLSTLRPVFKDWKALGEAKRAAENAAD